MKRSAIAAAILAALLLTGCAQTPDEPESTVTVQTGGTQSETPPPLVAETPDAGERPERDEAAFLEAFRENQAQRQTQIPNATDEQLLAAGQTACDADWDPADAAPSIIEGETAVEQTGEYLDSTVIFMMARRHLCPTG